MNKILIKNVNLHYGTFHALKNVNIAIPGESITAFIGPSGCGTSTPWTARTSMRRRRT